jgi:hypothetical protein
MRRWRMKFNSLRSKTLFFAGLSVVAATLPGCGRDAKSDHNDSYESCEMTLSYRSFNSSGGSVDLTYAGSATACKKFLESSSSASVRYEITAEVNEASFGKFKSIDLGEGRVKVFDESFERGTVTTFVESEDVGDSLWNLPWSSVPSQILAYATFPAIDERSAYPERVFVKISYRK